jgi:hypothetical protein
MIIACSLVVITSAIIYAYGHGWHIKGKPTANMVILAVSFIIMVLSGITVFILDILL